METAKCCRRPRLAKLIMLDPEVAVAHTAPRADRCRLRDTLRRHLINFVPFSLVVHGVPVHASITHTAPT